jgi:hypothetical protein
VRESAVVGQDELMGDPCGGGLVGAECDVCHEVLVDVPEVKTGQPSHTSL